MWTVLLGIIMIATVVSSQETDFRLVLTGQGPVRGYKDPVEDLYAFYNIPYAQAPTGCDKFKAPLPPSLRTEIFEAVDQRIICPQLKQPAFGINTENDTMQEDCLKVNIYVPNINKKNLSVLVYIHGGNFQVGYGNVLKPKKIVISKKIIVLNFNYRLGAHGFLCLGTNDIPGNAGLKDQVALLRWVQQNIEFFGGNPRDVTIAGYSAGSASVGLLAISQMASNLFSKLIQESGDINGPYDIQTDPIQNAKFYAKLLKYNDGDDICSLEEFYKSVSIDVLQSGITIYTHDFSGIVTPCVERDVGQEIFLASSPDDIIRSGNFKKLPTLIGFTNMEGLLREINFDQWKDDMNNDFSSFLPANLGFSNSEQKNRVAKEVKYFYFGDELISNKNILKYIDYITDSAFACPCLKTVKELVGAGNNDIYLFHYSFVDEASTPPVEYTNVRGAQHIAETYAVLDGINITYQDENHITDKLRNWKILMRETWADFAINGNPANAALPEWNTVSNDSLNYMALKEHPEIGKNPRKEACSFWEKIYRSYYQQPSPPDAPHPPSLQTETLEAVDQGIIYSTKVSR